MHARGILNAQHPSACCAWLYRKAACQELNNEMAYIVCWMLEIFQVLYDVS
jgi:hypothetical protein